MEVFVVDRITSQVHNDEKHFPSKLTYSKSERTVTESALFFC